MPTDPKWRTISRASGQPISLVQAVYIHLLVDASRNVTRGHVTVTTEDLASSLDVTNGDIEAVFDAMQGRVLDGQYLTGWDKRQVKREDNGDDETGAKSAAERKRAQREREKQERDSDMSRQRHDMSRNVTTDKSREDKEKEELPTNQPLPLDQPIVGSPPSAATEKKSVDRGTRLPTDWHLPKAWGEWALSERPAWTADRVRQEAEKFRDHWFANANQANGKKADWEATWRNWIRKAVDGKVTQLRPSPHVLPPAGVGAYGVTTPPTHPDAENFEGVM